jgi:hypothetical protein
LIRVGSNSIGPFEAQYEALQKAGFESRRNGSGIDILTGFRTNKPNVVKFYHRYVFPHRQESAPGISTPRFTSQTFPFMGSQKGVEISTTTSSTMTL